MTNPIPRRRAARGLAATLLLAAVPACHSAGEPRNRPFGQGLRDYFASRPTYGPEPRPTLTIGNYAGYNYGTVRRPRPEPMAPAPPPAFIEE